MSNNAGNNHNFLLTNSLGGYLWLDDEPASRYQGWFFTLPEGGRLQMVRLVETIMIPGAPSVTEVIRHSWKVERRRGKLVERFFVPRYLNALVYEVSRQTTMEIFLDVKNTYDNSEWGRLYQISWDDPFIMVTFRRDDAKLGPIHLAIRFNGKNWRERAEWEKRAYAFDAARHSTPDTRFVYRALEVTARTVIMAVGVTRQEAKDTANFVFNKRTYLKRVAKEKSRSADLPADLNPVKQATILTQQALRGLAVYGANQSKPIGLYAGLPWFFQFWLRDEALSLRALADLDQPLALALLWRRLEALAVTEDQPFTEPLDGVLWLVKRGNEFLDDGMIKRDEYPRLKTILGPLVDRLLKYHTREGLVVHAPDKTWMDSIRRSGSALELQALAFTAYSLAHRLSGSRLERGRYRTLQKVTRQQIRSRYLRGRELADGFDLDSGKADFTCRPNIFLAGYAAPDLLKPRQWRRAIDHALKELWLPWGGLATLPPDAPNFQSVSTGEDPRSYHQGDSWFYLNNLAAVVMARLSRRHYQPYINQILKASTDNILAGQIPDHHSELSSASFFDPAGSPAQAWSSALYLEMVGVVEIRKYEV